MKVGVLLPRSTTHPLIAYNFVDGLHSFLEYNQLTAEIDYITSSIGFGTDKELLEQKAEELIMQHQIDVIIAFADFPVIETLFPLVKALNKLLIVVNHGAKYPDKWEANPNVIHHHLGGAIASWCTGEKVAAKHQEAAFVSSYYDGGYSLCHALSASFSGTGEDIVFNLVGPQYKDKFDATPLLTFSEQRPDVSAFLTVLSGELVPEIHAQVNRRKLSKDITFYGSPVMIEESNLIQDQSNQLPVEGYVPWFANNNIEENVRFCKTFQDRTGRLADSFAVLGWDTGIILKGILSTWDEAGRIPEDVIYSLCNQELSAAKGSMKLHAETHQYIAPLYYVHSEAGETNYLHTIEKQQIEESLNRMINQKMVGISTGWLNTYLCS